MTGSSCHDVTNYNILSKQRGVLKFVPTIMNGDLGGGLLTRLNGSLWKQGAKIAELRNPSKKMQIRGGFFGDLLLSLQLAPNRRRSLIFLVCVGVSLSSRHFFLKCLHQA